MCCVTNAANKTVKNLNTFFFIKYFNKIKIFPKVHNLGKHNFFNF